MSHTFRFALRLRASQASPSRARHLVTLALLGATSWFAPAELLTPLRAGDDTPPPQEQTTEILRARGAWEKDSGEVLAAFQPVVSEASDSTVEVTDGQRRLALGTIVSADGQILTKASLLQGQPSITLSSGQNIAATVLGIDLQEDLALLKIEAGDLQPVTWFPEGTPELGAWVVSTDTGRKVRTIGVVSVAPRAIPRERGALGIRMDSQADGVVVAAYSGESTPAEKAGVKVGDKITEVNEEPVVSIEELQAAIARFGPGDAVILTVERDGAVQAIQVILDNLRLIDPNIRQREEQETLGANLSIVRTGFTSALQHDSALKPTDCGGPLLDLQGRAIGINIARAGRVASYALPPTLVEGRLVALRSGELSPEKVFQERIARLGNALSRLAKQIDEEYAPRLQQVDGELQTIEAERSDASVELEEAQRNLDELNKRVEALSADRRDLDARLKALEEKRTDYERQIQALRSGIQVR